MEENEKEQELKEQLWKQLHTARSTRRAKITSLGEIVLHEDRISKQLQEAGQAKETAIADLSVVEGIMNALAKKLLEADGISQDGLFSIDWDNEKIEVKQ